MVVSGSDYVSFRLSLELQKMNVVKNVVFGSRKNRGIIFQWVFLCRAVLTRFRLTQIVCKTLWKIIWDSKRRPISAAHGESKVRLF